MMGRSGASSAVEQAEASFLDHPRWDLFVSGLVFAATVTFALLRGSGDPLPEWAVASRQTLYGAVLTFVSVSFGFTTFSMGFFFTSSHPRVDLVRDAAGERIATNFRVVLRSMLCGLVVLLLAYILEGPATIDGAVTIPKVWPTWLALGAALIVLMRLARVAALMSHVIRLSGKRPPKNDEDADLLETYPGQFRAGAGVVNEGARDPH